MLFVEWLRQLLYKVHCSEWPMSRMVINEDMLAPQVGATATRGGQLVCQCLYLPVKLVVKKRNGETYNYNC